ncbi:MAG: metallophosphoesterase [Rickettsiales bacterium]|nr:metallophosphoesterase [Rickettsiales bacterium]|tara:strand:- start:1061 stop:1708 length:648 start_codon:yes stop_codon:yes gene_type:complete
MPIPFAGQTLWLDARAALWWPDEQTLIVADLHFEKASFLGQFANPLPHYDSLDTLSRLEELVAHYQPEQVVCLGDSLHDVRAAERFDEVTLKRLNNLCNSICQWVWVTGNHDPEIPAMICGARTKALRLHDILLVHEPVKENAPQIIGHFHPKLSLRIKGQKLRGKCFCVNEARLLLPAFGSFTGGLDSEHDAIAACMREAFSRYLIHRQKVWAV